MTLKTRSLIFDTIKHFYFIFFSVVLLLIVLIIINLYCCSLSLFVVIGTELPVVEADPAVADRFALTSVWVASPPLSEFERLYYN